MSRDQPNNFEQWLCALFAAAVEVPPDWGFTPIWFEVLLYVTCEPGYACLEFRHASDCSWDDHDLLAIARVLGAPVEGGVVSGGCGSCGHGARSTVTAQGARAGHNLEALRVAWDAAHGGRDDAAELLAGLLVRHRVMLESHDGPEFARESGDARYGGDW